MQVDSQPYIYPCDIHGALTRSDLKITKEERQVIIEVVTKLQSGQLIQADWRLQLSSLQCWPKFYACICDVALRRDIYKKKGQEKYIQLLTEAQKLANEKSQIQKRLFEIEVEFKKNQNYIRHINSKLELIHPALSQNPLWRLPHEMQIAAANRDAQQKQSKKPTTPIQMYPVAHIKRENDLDHIDSAAKRRKKIPPTPCTPTTPLISIPT